MIEGAGLWKSFGTNAVLRGADICVEAGELVALGGENGSGKTTLLRTLAGLIRPDRGLVRIAGEELERSNLQLRRRLSLCGHQSGLYLDLTVEENIRVFLSLRGITVPQRLDGGRKTGLDLGAWGLEPLMSLKVRSLSHGQRKRVALFLAVHAGAEVLLLDEPFAGLDHGMANRLEKAIEEQLAKGRAILLTSHERLPAAAARLLRLSGGRVAPA